MAEVNLKNIRKSFDGNEVIHGVSLDIEDREFVVFVGPSGCGKSTLLRMIAGLEDITAGEIFIGDRCVNDLHPADRGAAMVFQSYALYPHMNVFDNIGFGLKLNKVHKDEIRRKVLDVAKILRIEELLNRRPAQLSGGQRQRVAIGRTIVREPSVFLFDEPLSNLDAALRVQMRMELEKLHERLQTTMIYVTHDQVEAMTMANRIFILNDGVIEQIGSPLEVYRNPANLFVAGFIGSPKMNLISSSILGVQEKQLTIQLPGGKVLPLKRNTEDLGEGERLTLGIRPEHLKENKEGDEFFEGTVDVVEHLGNETYLHITDADKNLITMIADGDSNTQKGETVQMGFHHKNCHIFNATGKVIN